MVRVTHFLPSASHAIAWATSHATAWALHNAAVIVQGALRLWAPHLDPKGHHFCTAVAKCIQPAAGGVDLHLCRQKHCISLSEQQITNMVWFNALWAALPCSNACRAEDRVISG